MGHLWTFVQNGHFDPAIDCKPMFGESSFFLFIAGASDAVGKSPPSDDDQLSILKWTGIILILPGAQARPASQY
jgi:hypothetical protein